MKKVISVLLTLIMLLSLLSFNVVADENVGVLKAARVIAKSGDEITIPVSLVEHKGVCVIRVYVKYDSKALEYVDVVNSADEMFNFTVNSNNSDEIIVLMDSKSLANVTEDIELFKVKFKVKDSFVGRSIVRVMCSDGDATYFTGSGSTMDAVGFIPATSTGSVTVLCKEHVFEADTADGTKKCSNCGAVQKSDGTVSVDESQGLPEIDVSSEEASSGDAPNNISDENSNNDGNSKEPKVKFWYFIPVIAGVLIVGGVLIFITVKKNKR